MPTRKLFLWWVLYLDGSGKRKTLQLGKECLVIGGGMAMPTGADSRAGGHLRCPVVLSILPPIMGGKGFTSGGGSKSREGAGTRPRWAETERATPEVGAALGMFL